MTTIQITNVCKSYRVIGSSSKQVLKNVNLSIASNDILSLVGPNGCGKTTLLNVIAGLIKPDSGEIRYEPQQNFTRRVGYVWQDYRASLLPWLDAAENVAFPLRAHGMPKSERREIAIGLLTQFLPGVAPQSKCYELSGGQQQVLCLLRSSIGNPEVLLMDEPFAALDQQRNWNLAAFVEKLWAQNQVPTVFVSHDVDTAILMGGEIILLAKQGGEIKKRLHNPLPRPRSTKMLTAIEHVNIRKEIIDFLFSEGAMSDPLG